MLPLALAVPPPISQPCKVLGFFARDTAGGWEGTHEVRMVRVRDRDRVNGDVRIYGSNVSIKAEAAIDLNARVIRLKGDDEISLQAPKIWSQGKKGNLVPKTW